MFKNKFINQLFSMAGVTAGVTLILIAILGWFGSEYMFNSPIVYYGTFYILYLFASSLTIFIGMMVIGTILAIISGIITIVRNKGKKNTYNSKNGRIYPKNTITIKN